MQKTRHTAVHRVLASEQCRMCLSHSLVKRREPRTAYGYRHIMEKYAVEDMRVQGKGEIRRPSVMAVDTLGLSYTAKEIQPMLKGNPTAIVRVMAVGR